MVAFPHSLSEAEWLAIFATAATELGISGLAFPRLLGLYRAASRKGTRAVDVRRVLQLDNLVCRGSRRTHRWIDQHRVDPLQLGVGLARACRQSLLRLIHIQVAPANLRGSRVVLRDEDDNHLARPT
jgi:hypothetical protein